MTLKAAFTKKMGSFELDANIEFGNETVAILGASGSGKSMMLKCIAGMLKPDSGTIEVDGRMLFDSVAGINVPPRERGVGMLFQSYALFPNMTVVQNITAGMRPGGGDASRLVGLFRLEGLEKKYPRQLSGGQQQRVATARMLASEPRLILLDEPFSALDSHLKWSIEREIAERLSDFAGTTVLVSHNRDEAYRMSDRIAIMDSGRCSAPTDKHEFFENPRTVPAAVLSGCKNIMKASKSGEREVFVEEWGRHVETASDVPRDTGYLGVRSHAVSLGEGDNTMRCTVRDVIEGPFEHTLMLTVDGPPPCEGRLGTSVLYADVDRRGCKHMPGKGDSIDVSIPKASILLLA
ncbi:MAG: ATP-binding cassette domain-containing protein [Candidatus Methanoplasma sp.]|jgi:molybdate transport system ATP-binding protein|nr:ATP-binding cassette domain-containing protein [Candidatus Methanoplasma sp.]